MSRTIARLDFAEHDEFIETLLDEVVGNDASKKSTTIINDFKDRIEKLLAIPSIQVTAKAIAVMTSQPHVYYSSRILSDLRVVFSDDDLTPRAATIIHQLKVSFHKSPDHELQDIYVALDAEDLTDLRKTIDRALEKHHALKKVAIAANLSVLSIGDDG
ncbi:MAG TPA: hypothetical protein PKA53_10945 [Sphingobacterium sp.]|nr:hypothetical protein [Sphingobacterium sp.]